MGRVGVIARGARRLRRGGRVLEPFVALRARWRGRGELGTLAEHEVATRFVLSRDALYAGLYVNELVVRLLQREDAHSALFDAYDGTLALLARSHDERAPASSNARDTIILEPLLRRFEFALLDALGYGFPLDRDLRGEPVDPERSYQVLPDRGVVAADLPLALNDGVAGADEVPGDALLALADGQFDTAARLRLAKAITRAALAPLLGPRPLVSRSLFADRQDR